MEIDLIFGFMKCNCKSLRIYIQVGFCSSAILTLDEDIKYGINSLSNKRFILWKIARTRRLYFYFLHIFKISLIIQGDKKK